MKKGISLVALVITIIVLIVLTTAAILATTGEKGIFEKTKAAVEDNNKQVNKERVILAVSKIKLEAASKGENFEQYVSNPENLNMINSIITGEGFNSMELIPDSKKYKLTFNLNENVYIDNKGNIVTDVEDNSQNVSGLVWELKTTLDLPSGYKLFNVNFTVPGDGKCIGISLQPSVILYQLENGQTYDLVYRSDLKWEFDSKRTLTFETQPTGELLTWLQANATAK